MKSFSNTRTSWAVSHINPINSPNLTYYAYKSKFCQRQCNQENNDINKLTR